MLKRKSLFENRYNKFLHELKEEIISGKIKPGEFILPENTLSKVYELSRVSIRNALAELVEEGLIEKIPGKGNRVTIPKETQKQTITLGWFSNSYEIEIIRKIIKRFEQLNPFTKVNLQILPNSQYIYNLSQSLKHGSGPDVFIVSDYHFRELIETNSLDLLDPYLPEHIDLEKDSYEQVFEMFTYNQTIPVTPFVFSPVMICYNRRIFQEAGIPKNFQIDSWDDLLDLSIRTTKGLDDDSLINEYGFCFSSSTNRWPVFLLQNKGAFIADDQSSSVMNSKQNIEALKFCGDLMYKHQVSPIFSHGSNELAENLFMREGAAMILTTYYFMNEFRDHQIKWDVLPPPKNEVPSTLLLGGALGISATSKAKESAQALISFMVSTEAQTLLKQNGCTIPMLRVVAEDNNLLQPGIHPDKYNAFKEVMGTSKTIKDLHLTIKEFELVEREMQFFWANMEKAEDTCKRIEELLNNIKIVN
ncbi:extracellular solute-binding protein [Psychrobacillus sp. NPDC093180]|uniref:extracellular solute-binding protein n=1 Tax=Psychrobacillus sp. NPDC093180 TaxID=3364489 RepID=UPI0038286416